MKELLFDFQEINRQINEGVGNFAVEFTASSDLIEADGLKWKVANDQNVFKSKKKYRSEIRQQVFVRFFFLFTKLWFFCFKGDVFCKSTITNVS